MAAFDCEEIYNFQESQQFLKASTFRPKNAEARTVKRAPGPAAAAAAAPPPSQQSKALMAKANNPEAVVSLVSIVVWLVFVHHHCPTLQCHLPPSTGPNSFCRSTVITPPPQRACRAGCHRILLYHLPADPIQRMSPVSYFSLPHPFVTYSPPPSLLPVLLPGGWAAGRCKASCAGSAQAS